MNHDKVYYIPKSLSRDYSLLYCYTIEDAIIIFLLFAGGLYFALLQGVYPALIPSTVYTVLRYKHDNYTLYRWAVIGLSFLLGKQINYNEYTLFERGCGSDGDDESA